MPKSNPNTGSGKVDARGRKSLFQGEPLELLMSYLPRYLDTRGNRKSFWADFWSEWTQNYPPTCLDPTSAPIPSDAAGNASTDNASTGNTSANAPTDNTSPGNNSNGNVQASGSNDNGQAISGTEDPTTTEDHQTAASKDNSSQVPATSDKNPSIAPAATVADSGEDVGKAKKGKAKKKKESIEEKKAREEREEAAHAEYARNVPLEKIVAWFSNAASHQKKAESINWGSIISGLTTKQGAPRHTPAFRSYMKNNLYKEKVREEFQKKHGTDVSEDAHLSLLCAIAKDLFEKEPEEVQEKMREEADNDYVERKGRFDRATNGEIFYDEEWVEERRKAFAPTFKSLFDAMSVILNCKISVVAGEVLSDEGTMWLENIEAGKMSGDGDMTYSEWDPEGWRTSHVGGFVSFLREAYRRERGCNPQAPVKKTPVPALKLDNLLSLDDEPSEQAVEGKGGNKKKGKRKNDARGEPPVPKKQGRKGKKSKGKGKKKEEEETSEAETPEPDVQPTPSPPSSRPATPSQALSPVLASTPVLKHPLPTYLKAEIEKMTTPLRRKRIVELNNVPSQSEFDREEAIARNRAVIKSLAIPEVVANALRPLEKGRNKVQKDPAIPVQRHQPKRSTRNATALYGASLVPYSDEENEEENTDEGETEDQIDELDDKQPGPASSSTATLSIVGHAIISPRAPEWAMKLFKQVQLDMNASLWPKAITLWARLQESYDWENPIKVLDIKKRPVCFAKWQKAHRYDTPPPESQDIPTFSKDLLDWWKSINPDSRKSLTRDEEYDLSNLHAPGANGLYLILLGLRWWYIGEKVSEGSNEWRNLLTDVIWVMEKLIQDPRPTENQMEEPPAKKQRLQ
ncbi:hypothetical protein K435DRAFT_800040 [Dendrothele bispora CBS 962.96]|uniref:Uncharacterized protein n=1 Tax=Dendrothele bispora (strain CBS 962.96) TaxID=1314807 RepID=A0A4S8LTW9_DENBC|nr:hypothetical protein K435DRAFT_800040 [Dendrothele bispora CBS 962.96]